MNVGVIGCGMIAKQAHLPAYLSIENVKIIGVSDTNERAAKSCAKRFGVKKWFTDYHDLLKEDLDLVSVCTPIFTHAQITKDVASSGINVLVEKPMATNLKEADEMIDVCKLNGVKLCVMHNLRFVPCLLDAKKRILNGRIGRIVSVQVTNYSLIPMAWSHGTWFYYKWGMLEDVGIHMIDAINFLCNSELEDVKVIARDYNGHMDFFTHICLMLLFKNNASAFLDLSWVSGCNESSIKIQGTAGLLKIDVRNNYLREIHGFSTPLEDIKSCSKKSFRVMKAALNKTYFKAATLYHRQIISDFISSISEDRDPPVPGSEGRKALVIMDAIKSSLDTGISKFPHDIEFTSN
jgi:UDP-N-acetylglucosamine 3-dehydrogenase